MVARIFIGSQIPNKNVEEFMLLLLLILQLTASPSMVNRSHLGSVLFKPEGISKKGAEIM
jgi:hypothetical protein